MKLLVVDNHDSFTYNLVDYFKQLGCEVDVILNDYPPQSLTKEYDGVVLSPGPQKPEDANYLIRYIEFFHTKIPMLGVCLGHQAIVEFFGGTIKKGVRPMHGKVSLMKHVGGTLFYQLPNEFMVVRYHSWEVDVLPEVLKANAWCQESIMSFEHQFLPIYGLQFHPESILTEFGLDLLRNWLKNIS